MILVLAMTDTGQFRSLESPGLTHMGRRAPSTKLKLLGRGGESTVAKLKIKGIDKTVSVRMELTA